MDSDRKLFQFEKYATNVYGLPDILGSFSDGRRDPTYPTLDVVDALLHAALLRRPSINATEGDLKKADFQKLIGLKPEPEVKAFSAEVISNVLDKLDLDGPRNAIEDIIWQAERNKVFREGSYGTLRCVALDGWEPFCSYDRHCPHCLTREVPVKNPTTGEVEKRTQYYHRYVVAMLIAPVMDVVLDIEPVLNAEHRPDLGEDAHHEGELTAAHRLIVRLHRTYGTFIDALVFDALYANGPVMTKLDAYGYGGFIVLKKDNNEPLKEALALWQGEGPCQTYDDEDKKEHLAFWDVDDINTLDTYKGKVRVIRAVITHKDGTRKTWCLGIVGKRAQKVSRRTGLKIVRSRWHLENTGFGQWVKYWNLGRVYHHTANAIPGHLAFVDARVQPVATLRLPAPQAPAQAEGPLRHHHQHRRRDVPGCWRDPRADPLVGTGRHELSEQGRATRLRPLAALLSQSNSARFFGGPTHPTFYSTWRRGRQFAPSVPLGLRRSPGGTGDAPQGRSP